MYVTNPYPLQLFISLQERLALQYAEGTQRLVDLLKIVEVTVDTHKTLEPTFARRRDELTQAIYDLENLHYLTAMLSAAIRRAELRVAIPDLRDRIRYFEDTAALWTTYLAPQPSRAIPEEEIQAIQSQIAELRNAGSSESAISQRNALRAHKVLMPVLGREDLMERRASADRLQMNLEMERAELQRLMTQTRFSVQVPDALGAVLTYLGFDGSYVQPDASQVEEATADEHAAPPATPDPVATHG